MTTGEERAVLRLPLLRALLAQGLAVALVVVLVYLLALLPWRMSLFSVALLQGVVAAGIGWRPSGKRTGTRAVRPREGS